MFKPLNTQFSDPQKLFNDAFSLHQSGHVNEAIARYKQLLDLQPRNSNVLTLLGTAFLQLENFHEGVRVLEKSLSLNPNQPIACSNLGNGLHKLKRFNDALASCDRAIALQADFPSAHNNRADTLIMLKQYDEALASVERAISLKSDFAEAHCTRGTVLSELNRLSESLDSYNRAITLKPDFADAYVNQCTVLNELKRFDEAIANCNHAIALNPNHTDAHWNKAFTKLTLGDFEEGWKLYEWRWKTFLKEQARTYVQPLWLGDAPISGKTLLIYAEQGLGDVIQCCRYVTRVQALGAHVILELPQELMSLMSTLKGDIHIVERVDSSVKFDFYCPIMSLPLAFKATAENIPADVPYLAVDIEKQKIWNDRLSAKTRPRIGLVSSGSTIHKNDNKRSVPLSQFKPLFALPFEFHLLQKDIRSLDEAALTEFPHIHVHHKNLNDFSDTAALVNEMDLVISVDTSVAHLAGALGKPVWIVLPWVPDFRWLLDRSDSPWYPSATLFRQEEIGNWEKVVAELCQRLGTFTPSESQTMDFEN